MNFEITNLGQCKISSPLITKFPSTDFGFVSDTEKILYDVKRYDAGNENEKSKICFEKAGPRKMIFYDPARIRVAIITSGGLCPGINNVIRSIVMESHYRYGVQNILGIRYGFMGLNPATNYEPVELTPHMVRDAHKMGGTILGSSRDRKSVV